MDVLWTLLDISDLTIDNILYSLKITAQFIISCWLVACFSHVLLQITKGIKLCGAYSFISFYSDLN